MPVISYYTFLLQVILINIRIHWRLFFPVAGIFGTVALVLIVVFSSILLIDAGSIP